MKNLNKVLQAKHVHGQAKYHAFSFLKDGRKMSNETIDELVDGINYLVYQLIKDRYGKKDLMEMSKLGEEGIRMLNGIYADILKTIPGMSRRSENKNIRAIARMRDLIEDLK